MELIGRKAYLDWGNNKVIALCVYKKGYVPQGLEFTPGKFSGIPKVYDLVEVLGQVLEINPSDTAMPFPEGPDINQYLTEVFLTKKDRENNIDL